jgi:hypothetical protein
LAEKIGTSKQEISHVGSGRYRSGRIVEGIARELQTTVEWLVDGVGTPPTWWAEPAADARQQGPMTIAEQLRRAETIIDAMAEQLTLLKTENASLRSRLEALEKRGPRPPEAASR